MKIIFMGSAAFAVPSLIKLHESGYEIGLVVTQPDKPAGRGQKVSPCPVALEAQKLGLSLYQPKSLRSENVIKKIDSYKPDLIAIVAYGKLLPNEIIALAKLGCVNVHSSLLPKYRGAAPMNWAIVNGEKETGVTTIFIGEELDAGDILLSKSVPINEDDTSISLHDKLAPLGAELLIETIVGLAQKKIKPVAQKRSEATFAPILTKEHGHIDWKKDATAVQNLIRGLQPWPSAFTFLDGKMFKIFKATALESATLEKPGTILAAENCILVATGKGELCVKELQLEGKKRMTAAEFLRGHKIKTGTILG